MSRRLVFILASFVLMLYFSITLMMLNPLHTRSFTYSSFPYRHTPMVDWCKSLRFRNPPGDIVALASFPGSGNTWLRYLLQQATGILTGSIYLDRGLQRHGFPAENVMDGSVLVVKTHEAPVNKFKSAIVLIRNPRDAILAEFNRRLMGHIGTAPKASFKRRRAVFQSTKKMQHKLSRESDAAKKGSVLPANSTVAYARKRQKKFYIEWELFVSDHLVSYENFHIEWLRNFSGPVHVVFYETLVRNTGRTLRNILHFLNYNATYDDLTCALLHREGIYRRSKKHKDFDPFTPEMYAKISAVQTRVKKLLTADGENNLINVNGELLADL